MADEVQQHRQAAAEAQARGDTRAANAAFQAELRALSVVQSSHSAENLDTETLPDDDALDWKTLREDAETQDTEPDEGPSDPVPVEITSSIYSEIAEAFGQDEAAALQNAWGDHALANYEIAGALLRDHPTLAKAYDEVTANGTLSIAGAQTALEEVLKLSDHESAEALSKAHPELDALFLDHFNPHTGTLSPAGVYRILAYVGHRSGYKYTYRGKQR